MVDKVNKPTQQELALPDPTAESGSVPPLQFSADGCSPKASTKIVDLAQIRRQQSSHILISQLIKLGF